MLVRHGAPLDTDNPRDHPSPLGTAATTGYIEITRTLLEAGANPHPSPKILFRIGDHHVDLLQAAAYPGFRVEVMELLLHHGYGPGDDMYPMGSHPLTLAVKWNNVYVVELLLDRVKIGASIVRTALKECTCMTIPEIERKLLEIIDLLEGGE